MQLMPNQKAVETVPLDAENAALEAFQAAGDGSAPYPLLMAALKAAATHIRAEAFAKLAAEFEKREQACRKINSERRTIRPSAGSPVVIGKARGYEHAAEICRRLAAQEAER